MRIWRRLNMSCQHRCFVKKKFFLIIVLIRVFVKQYNNVIVMSMIICIVEIAEYRW